MIAAVPPCPAPPGDPAFYKVLAVLVLLVWGSFFIRYGRVLWKRHVPPTLEARLHPWKYLEPFAWAVLVVAAALVVYSIATLLRQLLGPDYEWRDFVRSSASLSLLGAGFVFHRVFGRARRH